MRPRWPEKETRKALVNMAKTAGLFVLMLVNRQNRSKGDETVGRSLLVSMKYILYTPQYCTSKYSSLAEKRLDCKLE
jgi:hypothetical protein